MKMYCITINDNHYEKIKSFGYIPVGLGKDIISSKFKTDKNGENISHKNPYYGEYSFHYWMWKNELKFLKETEWIGFCQYRKYWSLSEQKNYKDFNDLKSSVIKEIPKNFDSYEAILGKPIYVNQFKLTKFLKKNISKVIKNPSLLFDKTKRNIKFHFDLMHGEGNLDKAISLLDNSDRKDFNEFVNGEVSFHPHNMFMCNSKKILIRYYETIFPWLERCENIFGFNLHGYGLQRIYGFLAERFMSYWFRKYTKFNTMPIIFKDITEID